MGANADNLIGRILSEAEENARQISADADSVCAQIAAERDRRIEEQAASALNLRNTQVNEILDGAKTRARLEGRKELLAAKRLLLDHTFEIAYEQIANWSEKELGDLYGRILHAEAVEGDIVMPAKADTVSVQSAVQTCGIHVTISDSFAPIDHGFVLYGKSYEKDCSLLAILSELREREETKVAGVLFS